MVDLQNWLLCFGAELQALWEEMAQWAMWLANKSPPWPAYRTLMACCLVALNKQSGVRPVGISQIYCRLFAKCLLATTGYQVTAACDNLNLCTSLLAGIKGAVHAMGDAWEKAENAGRNLPEMPPNATTTHDDATHAIPKPYTTLLVDACNGFNELSCKAGLWTVCHQWPGGSRFAFNCYCHAMQLIIHQVGQPCSIFSHRKG